MKAIFALLLPFLFYSSIVLSQGFGVNENGAAANNAAILDVSSTQKGFLPPRMTIGQRDSIVNPSNGLLIFNLTTGCPNYYFQGSWYEWKGEIPYPTGTIHCSDTTTAIVGVLNPTTGKTWMDRNLGAKRAATAITDSDAYGDFYQWGRGGDGHQCRNSQTTNVLSSTEKPEHGLFITTTAMPMDWLLVRNPGLWQGKNGPNNPCPLGFRIPTSAELQEEFQSWSVPGMEGGFASPMKWVSGGIRGLNGNLSLVGLSGVYWSSTVSGDNSTLMLAGLNTANLNILNRGYGFSVRCIKNESGTF